MPLTPEQRRHLDLLRLERSRIIVAQLAWRKQFGVDGEVEAIYAGILATLDARIIECEAGG